CGKNPTITELIDYEEFCGVVSEDAQQAAAGSTITATDLKGMLDRNEDIFLVDVREPNEYEIVSIPGATLIPKGELLSGAALERRGRGCRRTSGSCCTARAVCGRRRRWPWSRTRASPTRSMWAVASWPGSARSPPRYPPTDG